MSITEMQQLYNNWGKQAQFDKLISSSTMWGMDFQEKSKMLDEVNEEIEKCAVCPMGKTGIPVPGEGNPDARVVFIGEAPGKTEAQTGRPFVGRSGKFLRKQIHKIGLKEEDVYITSPVKYLPLAGTPTHIDIDHGRSHLIKQLAIIDPDIIVLMGRVAAEGVLEEKIPVAKMHGTMLKRHGKSFFFLYHPAAAIRFQKLKKVFEEDMLKLQSLIAADEK